MATRTGLTQKERAPVELERLSQRTEAITDEEEEEEFDKDEELDDEDMLIAVDD